MKKFILNRANGGVSIMFLLMDVKPEVEIARLSYEVTSFREMGESEVLPRRDYREAWSDTGVSLDVDLEKAKEVKRNKLRSQRTSLLKDLDVESIKAIESEDSAKLSEVKTEKQRLRDITDDPRIEEAVSLDDLDSITIEKVNNTVEADSKSAEKKTK